MNHSLKKIVFSAKGFGDCLIALKGIESATSEVTLVTPVYNKPLIEALNCQRHNVLYIESITKIPAIVTIRASKLHDVLRDVLLVRSSVVKAVGYSVAYVDCWRAAAMWGVSRAVFLPQHQNIYCRYLTAFGHPTDTAERLAGSVGFQQTILICPSARITCRFDRRLNPELIKKIDVIAKRRGLQVRVLLLEDDEATLGYSQILYKMGVSVVLVRKNFGDLINTLKNYENIISACSLTSHIAEYYSKNLMVLTPVDNALFLQFAPLSVYRNGNRSVFTDLAKIDDWITSTIKS